MTLCPICVERPGTTEAVMDGKTLTICTRCDGEHPRQGGYSFDECGHAVKRSGADGNKHKTGYRKGGAQ